MEVVPSVTLRFQQFVQIINRQTSPLCAPCMRTYFCDCMFVCGGEHGVIPAQRQPVTFTQNSCTYGWMDVCMYVCI